MVANINELHDTLIQLLGQIAPDTIDILQATDDLQDVLEIDSFDFLNFLIAIDETFSIEIPERDYNKVRTLAQLEDYLANS